MEFAGSTHSLPQVNGDGWNMATTNDQPANSNNHTIDHQLDHFEQLAQTDSEILRDLLWFLPGINELVESALGRMERACAYNSVYFLKVVLEMQWAYHHLPEGRTPPNMLLDARHINRIVVLMSARMSRKERETGSLSRELQLRTLVLALTLVNHLSEGNLDNDTYALYIKDLSEKDAEYDYAFHNGTTRRVGCGGDNEYLLRYAADLVRCKKPDEFETMNPQMFRHYMLASGLINQLDPLHELPDTLDQVYTRVTASPSPYALEIMEHHKQVNMIVNLLRSPLDAEDSRLVHQRGEEWLKRLLMDLEAELAQFSRSGHPMYKRHNIPGHEPTTIEVGPREVQLYICALLDMVSELVSAFSYYKAIAGLGKRFAYRIMMETNERKFRYKALEIILASTTGRGKNLYLRTVQELDMFIDQLFDGTIHGGGATATAIRQEFQLDREETLGRFSKRTTLRLGALESLQRRILSDPSNQLDQHHHNEVIHPPPPPPAPLNIVHTSSHAAQHPPAYPPPPIPAPAPTRTPSPPAREREQTSHRHSPRSSPNSSPQNLNDTGDPNKTNGTQQTDSQGKDTEDLKKDYWALRAIFNEPGQPLFQEPVQNDDDTAHGSNETLRPTGNGGRRPIDFEEDRPLSFQVGDDILQTRPPISSMLHDASNDGSYSKEVERLQNELNIRFEGPRAASEIETDGELDLRLGPQSSFDRNNRAENTKSLGYLPKLEITTDQALLHSFDEKFVVLPEEDFRTRSETNLLSNGRQPSHLNGGSRRASEQRHSLDLPIQGRDGADNFDLPIQSPDEPHPGQKLFMPDSPVRKLKMKGSWGINRTASVLEKQVVSIDEENEYSEDELPPQSSLDHTWDRVLDIQGRLKKPGSPGSDRKHHTTQRDVKKEDVILGRAPQKLTMNAPVLTKGRVPGEYSPHTRAPEPAPFHDPFHVIDDSTPNSPSKFPGSISLIKAHADVVAELPNDPPSPKKRRSMIGGFLERRESRRMASNGSNHGGSQYGGSQHSDYYDKPLPPTRELGSPSSMGMLSNSSRRKGSILAEIAPEPVMIEPTREDTLQQVKADLLQRMQQTNLESTSPDPIPHPGSRFSRFDNAAEVVPDPFAQKAEYGEIVSTQTYKLGPKDSVFTNFISSDCRHVVFMSPQVFQVYAVPVPKEQGAKRAEATYRLGAAEGFKKNKAPWNYKGGAASTRYIATITSNRVQIHDMQQGSRPIFTDTTEGWEHTCVSIAADKLVIGMQTSLSAAGESLGMVRVYKMSSTDFSIPIWVKWKDIRLPIGPDKPQDSPHNITVTRDGQYLTACTPVYGYFFAWDMSGEREPFLISNGRLSVTQGAGAETLTSALLFPNTKHILCCTLSTSQVDTPFNGCFTEPTRFQGNPPHYPLRQVGLKVHHTTISQDGGACAFLTRTGAIYIVPVIQIDGDHNITPLDLVHPNEKLQSASAPEYAGKLMFSPDGDRLVGIDRKGKVICVSFKKRPF